jgi:hypothetical protein
MGSAVLLRKGLPFPCRLPQLAHVTTQPDPLRVANSSVARSWCRSSVGAGGDARVAFRGSFAASIVLSRSVGLRCNSIQRLRQLARDLGDPGFGDEGGVGAGDDAPLQATADVGTPRGREAAGGAESRGRPPPPRGGARRRRTAAGHVTGTTNRTYGATIRKLRDWYLRQWAKGGDGLTPEVAAYLIEQVLVAIEPGARSAAALDLVRSLESIYASHQAPRPAWLSAVRDEYRQTDGPDGPAQGLPREALPPR